MLQKQFGTDSYPPAPSLAGEIIPVVLIEPYLPENFWLGAHKLCGACHAAAGGVATRIVYRLRNPVNSGVVAVVESLFASATGVDQIHIGVGAAATDFAQLPTVPGKSYRDRRIAGAPTCNFTFDADPPGVLGQNIGIFRALANTGVELVLSRTGIVLSPGQAVDIDFTTDNQTDCLTAWWRERALPEVEQAP